MISRLSVQIVSACASMDISVRTLIRCKPANHATPPATPAMDRLATTALAVRILHPFRMDSAYAALGTSGVLQITNVSNAHLPVLLALTHSTSACHALSTRHSIDLPIPALAMRDISGMLKVDPA